LLPTFDRSDREVGSPEKAIGEDSGVLVIVEFAVLSPGDTADWTQKIEAILRHVSFWHRSPFHGRGSYRYQQTPERRVTDDQTL